MPRPMRPNPLMAIRALAMADALAPRAEQVNDSDRREALRRVPVRLEKAAPTHWRPLLGPGPLPFARPVLVGALFMAGVSAVPLPRNEPVLNYAPGSKERAEIKADLEAMAHARPSIPLVIGDEKMTGGLVDVTMPHDHHHVLARASSATPAQIERAIEAAEAARPAWASLSFESRAAVVLKAADLVTGKYRSKINGATMLGQSKTVHQAEIEAACEQADFYRFNVAFADALRKDQPLSPPGQWNRTELRPLDGFVFAICPFNFTAIAANLPMAPALMGNTCLWKPAPQQIYSAHLTMQILLEAGLPPGVINLVAGDPVMIGDKALLDPRLGGVHFTGSTKVFQQIHRVVGQNIDRYRQYPRIVGETGGKDFIFAHPSADVDALAIAIVRGGFEYQGQKCSAASRIYVPKSIWPALKDRLLPIVESLPMGDPRDFSNFLCAVIDRKAFDKITRYIELGKSDSNVELLAGGAYDDRTGYFVRPTIFESSDPNHALMTEEIFGPVVTVFSYEDRALEATLDLCDGATQYALTGAVFSEDRGAAEHIAHRLRFAAGNFYINDKPTGAVVGQQPFGGSRASGTNDKAGSAANLLRWTSVRTLKESLTHPSTWRYPFMDES